MCQFKSGIIFKNRVVLAPAENESHSALLESLGVEDTTENAMTKFVRIELVPKDDDKTTDVSEWKYIVDQDITPDWYDEDIERYEQEFREAVKEHLKDRFIIMCGKAWNKVKINENGTYYVLDGIIGTSQFGDNNNYAESDVRKYINNSDLLKELKAEFGDRLMPITTDLLSLDGLDDYGIVEGDLLAPLTLDLYRENRRNIPSINKWYWLATPYSTPSGYGSRCVGCVLCGGDACCGDYGYSGGVRPFFILKS